MICSKKAFRRSHTSFSSPNITAKIKMKIIHVDFDIVYLKGRIQARRVKSPHKEIVMYSSDHCESAMSNDAATPIGAIRIT